MDRNKDVYALSDCGIVVSSDFDKGGTWAGAVENLGADWVPLFVRRDPAALAGNEHLVRRGGIPLTASELESTTDWAEPPVGPPQPQAGEVVARQEAASRPGTWQADAQGTARQYYQKLNSRLLKQVNATTTTAAGGNVYVTVSGQVAVSVFPFFGLHLTVSATAGGPVECFRPAGQGGAC